MTATPPADPVHGVQGRDDIAGGRTSLGIEVGSTRIKACLIGSDPSVVLAAGSTTWENTLTDGLWTHDLDDLWRGLQSTFGALVADAELRHGIRPDTFGAIGVSAMMHGYLALDADGVPLVPFRTWRNVNTVAAATELTDALGAHIPLRWSIAHLHQAVLDGEAHLEGIERLTTLAGFVHEKLTGEHVLGIGDASGMFPIDPSTADYDARMLRAYDGLAADRLGSSVRRLLPDVLPAGSPAGVLTSAGAMLLDPTGRLRPGVPLCPPEGDAGTGMVATNSITPRSGNVSAGTSIFAMAVLDRPLSELHRELDLVTTPVGDAVAMVHCNNGASELGAWVGLFSRFSAASGHPSVADDVFEVLLREASMGEADAGGLLAYNHLAAEPLAGLDAGRPLFVRTPDSAFTLANFMRAQVHGVFGTLALGMEVLEAEGFRLDRVFAHGGVFRTAGVAQRFLAAALRAPVVIGELASEGGAWGIALLASYLAHADTLPLAEYLDREVFASARFFVTQPDPDDVAGFAVYLDRYRAGLAIESVAVTTL